MIMNTKWLASAHLRMKAMRVDIKRECFPYHHWPLWVFGKDIGFPGDDVEMPRSPPANDNGIGLVFR